MICDALAWELTNGRQRGVILLPGIWWPRLEPIMVAAALTGPQVLGYTITLYPGKVDLGWDLYADFD